MLKQINLLLKVQMLNAFGYNEAKYSSDKKLKNRFKSTAIIYAFLGLFIAGYMSASTAGMINFGMKDVVPAYLSTVTSLIILFFTMFKAGDGIFNLKSYEKVIVLPIKSSSIIVSRFLAMYIFNIAMAMVVVVPASLIYGAMEKTNLFFYFVMIIGTICMPLIPMVIATIIGAGIMAISSRMKHKNIVNIVFSLAATLAIIILSFSINSNNMSNQKFFDISSGIIKQLEKCYPPSILYSNSALNNSFVSLLVFVLISVVLFAALVYIIQKYFTEICTNLKSNIATRNYKVQGLQQNTQLKALFLKEIKRYFSSSIYVMNTGIGYILMIVFAVAVIFVGEQKINEYMHLGNAVQVYAPLLFAFMCGISAPTTSAISIEGKQWWIGKTLPVKSKTIFDSKLLVSFVVAIPCFIVSVLIMSFAVRMNLLEILALIIVPLSYIVYSVVVGLYINIKVPLFNWESETVAVKQSSAVLISMVVDFVSIGVLIGVTFLIKGISKSLIMLIFSAVVFAVSAIIYRKIYSSRLIDIE